MKVTKGMKTMIDVESLILMFMNSHLAICHRYKTVQSNTFMFYSLDLSNH